MKLTELQEEYIFKRVEGEINLRPLRSDIIDHIFCVVEHAVESGDPFEMAVDRAIREVAPYGLKNLEYQTVFLLYFNKIIIMKKFTYILGFLGSVLVTGGVVLKLLDLAGSMELFLIGALFFFVLFIPLLLFDRYKLLKSKDTSKRYQVLFGITSLSIITLSVCFKLFHLQGTYTLMLLGTVLFITAFLPFFFYRLYKNSRSKEFRVSED